MLNDFDAIETVIAESVESYVYHRWVQEVGVGLADSEQEAVRWEREIRAFIRESVKFEFADDNIDVLEVDWLGPQGREIVDSLFEQAYELMELGEE